MFFITIVIPSYNRCEQLDRALDSVFKQTYSHFEVIVIDDGSEDNTAEMVQKKISQCSLYLPR